MRILYAIQGTGNGHLSRAVDIIPALQNHGEVDLVVSGTQADLSLPFPVKYKFTGLSFIFGKNGGVDLWKTVRRARPRKFIKAIKLLPIEDYDLIINDFEPVTAWACFTRDKPCISLSHQAATLSGLFPMPPSEDRMGKFILQHYAPADERYGFHFKSDGDKIFTPVIRKQVREQKVSNDGHYTVYLPSYDDATLVEKLSAFSNVKWDVFSKHNQTKAFFGNITIQPINSDLFTQSMASSKGVLCGAGFETPAEALYLGKKLLVIPMAYQYEQQLNAAALASLGVPVVKSLKSKYESVVKNWLENDQKIEIDYPDNTQEIIDRIVENHKL